MDKERKTSNGRPLERSASYSEAIRSCNSCCSSIEIQNLANSNVYTNEEIKKAYRTSQNTAVPFLMSGDGVYDTSDGSSVDEVFHKGLVMKIDVESYDGDPVKLSSPSTTVQVSESSPRADLSPSEDLYDLIETDGSVFSAPETSISSPPAYSTPYSRRKRKNVRHRLRHGRPNRSRRVVFKSGGENVPVRSNIPAKSIKYMRDLVNTVINSKWRVILFIMVVCHCVFWLFFAGIWYWVSRAYGEELGDGREHCVTGTSTFAGMLLLAIETQMTIGYGSRFPNEECPEAIIVMVLEIVAGTALSGGLSSLLFTKLVRPNRHVTSVGFSKKATVCLRDGELCLMFRVWDLLNVHSINTTITAYMLKPIRTLEGESVQNYIHQLKLVQANAFLLWPITVVHIIDQNSPLYYLSAEDMMDFRFEIVVCLTGSSHNMGTMTQSRTSYLSKEICWGYRFNDVLKYNKKEESYEIETDKLNSMEQVETPLCSASTLKEYEGMPRKGTYEYSLHRHDSNTNFYQDSTPSTYRTENNSSQNNTWSYQNATAALASTLASKISPELWQDPKRWQNKTHPKGWQNTKPTSEGWQNTKTSESWQSASRNESVQSTPSFNRHNNGSLQSTPSFGRHGTQRSFGWSFKKYSGEHIQDRFKGLNRI